MKNENSTAPRAARYSAPCCSQESRTAPRAVRIGDYSAPCGSNAPFWMVRTAPRAVLISITKRSAFSFVPLHRFTAVASAVRCGRFKASRTTTAPLHRLHPSNMSQIAPFDLAGGDDPYCTPPGPHGTRALHTSDRNGAHPLHHAHLVHDVHHLRPMQNHTTRNA